MRRWSVISAKKQKLLDLLVKFNKKHGYPPTNKELAELTGWALSTVHRICMQLVEAGHLRREETNGRKFWPVSA